MPHDAVRDHAGPFDTLLFAPQRRQDMRFVARIHLGNEQLLLRAADHLLRVQPHPFAVSAIGNRAAHARVPVGKRPREAVDHQAHQTLALLQRQLGLLALGDVGVGGDKAAVGHRRTLHLDGQAIRPNALESMRHRRQPCRVDNGLHGLVDVAVPVPVLAALGVVADEVLETGLRRFEQFIRKAQQLAVLRVRCHQFQVAVEHAEAARQVLQDAGHDFVFGAQLGFQRAPGRDVLERAHEAHRLACVCLDLADRADPERPPAGGDERQFQVPAVATGNSLRYGLRDQRPRFMCIKADGLVH